MHFSTALRTLQCYLIDVWAVKLYCLGSLITAHLE